MDLQSSILRTVGYFSVFGFAPTLDELYRLLDHKASRSEFEHALRGMDGIVIRDRFCCLQGQENYILRRQQKNAQHVSGMRRGIFLGRLLGIVPGVRGVFLTGSMAAGSGLANEDFDYFIVVEPNRVWFVRLLLYFRSKYLERRYGVRLCINYIVDEKNLEFQERNRYVASELVLMVATYDEGVLDKIKALNGWVEEFFPNFRWRETNGLVERQGLNRLLDKFVGLRIVDVLEYLERRRAMFRLLRIASDSPEVRFSPVQYKGHFAGHGKRILETFAEVEQKLEQ